MRWSMRLKLPIRSLRCQGEDGADHSNPGKLLLDGEWEITTTQLDLLPAHALKLRQVSPGMVHREESLTLVCRPHEAKLEQVSTVHHGTRNPCFFFHHLLRTQTFSKSTRKITSSHVLFTHPVTLLGSCSSTVTPLASDSFKSSD
nr:PREDICTED: uncharacterized protein LOC103995761 isoform X1 [Musa acuminata subsp. malaccensis]